jgi:arginine utilization protein RocB
VRGGCRRNTPAWGFGIDWPAGAGPAGIPIVNAGPWGRDYHTRLERLHAGYAFEVLPELLLAMVRDVLRSG